LYRVLPCFLFHFFLSSYFTEDDDIPTLAAKLELATPALMAGDFFPDSALGTVTKLVEEQSCRDAEKEEWLLRACGA
jgi:hypothetical protein